MLVALPSVRQRLAAVPTAALGLGLLGLSVVLDLRYPDLPAAAGAGLLVASLLKRPSFGGRFAVALGAVSYSVYLWHLAILGALDRPATWTGAALALAVTLAIAAAVFLLVERPAIRLGQRINGRELASRAQRWYAQYTPPKPDDEAHDDEQPPARPDPGPAESPTDSRARSSRAAARPHSAKTNGIESSA